ncbi:uncharacterized protein E0L32_004051 [Thyridium curvatum]|uniref:Uncharacterized protein n=1 Tax=Thyridium curvatum TaxID=1093900 RepID=A0A507B295_9PEZI|nr:uncharacterized protein E0L32_004051 [Thyridium curvatum]TPX16402.1 hypothetical protein E0L32_004051 [Thyridium curvatum]
MSSHREGVNPLRPYYVPPSIGEPSDFGPKSGPNPFSHGNATGGKYASKARDIFSDIDYKDYIAEPSPSVVRSLKELVDELLWKYTSTLMAQPFEVAKTVLQLRIQDDPGALSAVPSTPEPLQRQSSYRNSIYGDVRVWCCLLSSTLSFAESGHADDSLLHVKLPDSDSDPDEPAYFTSNIPNTPTPAASRSRSQRLGSPISPPGTPRSQPKPPNAAEGQLTLRRPDSILDVISQLWSREGAWGVWKGSNASFLYSVLQSLLENWSRSLLSALFNVPDLGVRDDVDRLIDIASPYPWLSLCVAAAAAVTTGVLLAPLDMVRTRLLVTSVSSKSRRTLSNLRNLPSYFCPSSIFLPTVFHSLIHPILSLSTPLVLRTQFRIDRDLSPTTFSIAKFCSSAVALFVKLPIETVLRRGQMAVWSSPSYAASLETAPAPRVRGKEAAMKSAEADVLVPLGKYDGLVGTMYKIVTQEGSRPVSAPAPPPPPKAKASGSKRGKPKIAETVFRRGQGVEGLWRGWKVGWWGLVGLWTAGVVGGGGDGEF